jgi:hypothetical protein
MTQRNKFHQINYLQENVLLKIIISAGKKCDGPQRCRLWVVEREALGVTK